MKECFATGHTIPEGEPIQFDHIHAFALGGVSEIDNIAPMCGKHNKEKGVLPLQDFRIKLSLEEFFATGRQTYTQTFASPLKIEECRQELWGAGCNKSGW